uniref:Wsv021-like protein n=1 Tax=Penaeus monodon endogenous nimavirus TaxID=2133795 RepID=A0A401IPL1_9VIRU|nr:MAG: wsv021-like protein [Penaeus monodon endogenous nimavirus]GBG35549.1 wsv021-like protein [Penaeus monodon endogenous nimavirus]
MEVQPVLDWIIQFVQEFDWTVVVGIMYLVCLIAVIVTVLVRYMLRRRLLDRGDNSKIILGNANLPVAYLLVKGGGHHPMLRFMWLTPNQFVVFATIHDRINTMKHGMCTDSVSWQQFALLAAAAGYRRLASIVASDTQKKDTDDLISDIITKEMEDIVEPYINWIFRPFGSAKADLDQCRDNPKSLRGIPGRPIPSLADDIVNIVVR